MGSVKGKRTPNQSRGSGIPKFPRCEGNDVVRYSYGLPSPEMAEAGHRGEIEIGGCMPGSYGEFFCKTCGAGFDRSGKICGLRVLGSDWEPEYVEQQPELKEASLQILAKARGTENGDSE